MQPARHRCRDSCIPYETGLLCDWISSCKTQSSDVRWRWCNLIKVRARIYGKSIGERAALIKAWLLWWSTTSPPIGQFNLKIPVRTGNVYFWFIIKWNSTLFCNRIGWNYNVCEVELAAKLDACPLCNLVKDIMKCVCGGRCAWKVRRCLPESVCRGRPPRISSYRRRMTSPLSWGCKKGRNSNGSPCVFCPFCA